MKSKNKSVGKGTASPNNGPTIHRKLMRKTKDLSKSIQKEQLDGESFSPAQSSIALSSHSHDVETAITTPCTHQASPAKSVHQSESHTNNKKNEIASSIALPNPTIPFNELSPNSPPKKPPSTSESMASDLQKNEPSCTQVEDRESFSTAISSLLAHHQRENHNSSTTTSFETSKFGRRKRQLLGRAPSNLSARSLSLSRASSIDTMNTDGIGTPIEPTHSATSLKFPESKNPDLANADRKNSITAASALTAFASQAKGQDAVDQTIEPLQMTQLGYEDPEALIWREKLMRKMGVNEGGGMASDGLRSQRLEGIEKRNRIGVVVKDSVVGSSRAGDSIARRTRRAGGR